MILVEILTVDDVITHLWRHYSCLDDVIWPCSTWYDLTYPFLWSWQVLSQTGHFLSSYGPTPWSREFLTAGSSAKGLALELLGVWVWSIFRRKTRLNHQKLCLGSRKWTFFSISAKQRKNLSGHLLATCQWDQVSLGGNQLLLWRPITGPKGKLRCFLNPDILRGG